MRRAAWKPCARPAATAWTLWLTCTRAAHPRLPFSSAACSPTTTCIGTKSRAGTSISTAWWKWRALPFPIATGERLAGRWQFRELFEKGGCAVAQPDVSHCGGISEARRIAAMAETYMISVACHNPAGPVATAASLHVGFAVPNYLIQEVVRIDVPWRNDVVTEPIRMDGGVARAPVAPGLGIEVNEKEAAKHPFAPEVTMPYFHRDGSVADW